MRRFTTAPAEAFRRWRRSFATDISSPARRKRALQYQLWFDHGVLRLLWANMHQVTPDFWRSNHPTPARYDKLAALGIRTVISLRGSTTAPWALLEREACDRVGLQLETVSLQSRAAPQKEELLRLIAYFKTARSPILVHCKSGADRTGLVSAIYLMVIKGVPVSEAKKMLSIRYLHMAWSKAGVLDHLLNDFETSDYDDFEQWLAYSYDADKLQRDFLAGNS